MTAAIPPQLEKALAASASPPNKLKKALPLRDDSTLSAVLQEPGTYHFGSSGESSP